MSTLSREGKEVGKETEVGEGRTGERREEEAGQEKVGSKRKKRKME